VWTEVLFDERDANRRDLPGPGPKRPGAEIRAAARESTTSGRKVCRDTLSTEKVRPDAKAAGVSS
jgi:hypothetical protein